MNTGIYESLITNALREKLEKIDTKRFYIADQKSLDIEEAIHFLSLHLTHAFRNALKEIKIEKKFLVNKQIEITNKLLNFLSEQIDGYEFTEDLIET